MFLSNRKIYLLFYLFLILIIQTNTCSGQTELYHNKIGALLKNVNGDTSKLNKLNLLVSDGWSETSGSELLVDDAHLVLDAARKSGDDIIIADALINLTKMYLTKYESSQSLEYALEAFKHYENRGEIDKKGYTLLQIGIIYYTQNNFTKSLEYYNNSVNEYEISGNEYYLSTLFYLSGINYSRLENYPSAHVFFNRALELKIELKDDQGIAETNLALGELFISESMPDSAIFYVSNAIEYAVKTNNLYGIAKGNIVIAEAYYSKNDLKTAEEKALEGLMIADKTKARELIIDARKVLYLINAAALNHKAAFTYLNGYHNLRDSVINEKTSKNIARLEADYIIDKKQNEILFLENQNRNRTIISFISLITGILAILLAIVFYNKQQHKQKANQALEKAYKDLENTQKQLIHHEKLASLGQLTAGIAHEIKNPLNFVNNFSQISIDLLKEIQDEDSTSERKIMLEDITLNLEKILKHGERANSIIIRMLDHSRTGERELFKTDINKLIQEYYTLAFQAMRINNPGFYCNTKMDINEKIPEINIVTQEISRVFLNIFNNSLYALSHKKLSDENFLPEINVKTGYNSGNVQISIRDNGPGIPESIIDKIFQPFFTTKPAGDGTGLGLSLSYDIINAHGGTITAKNLKESGVEFKITLPV